MAERHVSLPKPFASGDVHEWFQRFEICCRANSWNAATQALKLPMLLEGEALAVWLELSEEQQKDYTATKEKLLSAMMPMKFVSLDEFHRRKLRPGEALPVYLHDMKKLLAQAMPDLDKPARDQLLLHQFLAGVPEAVSRQLRATGETTNLDTTVERARLLMTIDNQGHSAAVAEKPVHTSEVEVLREQVAALTEQVVTLSTASRRTANSYQQRPRRCFGCNRTGHISRDCPYRRGQGFETRCCFVCNQPGHISRDCRQRQGNDRGAPVQGNRRPYLQ